MEHNRATLPPNQTLDFYSKWKHQDAGASVIPGPVPFGTRGPVSWSLDRSIQNQQLFKLAFSCTLVSCRYACRVDTGQRLSWFRRKKSVPGYKAEKAGAEELHDSGLAACLGFPLLTSPRHPHWDRSIHHSPSTLLLWLFNAQHLSSHVLPSVW